MTSNAEIRRPAAYTGAFLFGKKATGLNKAARANVIFKAFIDSFINSKFRWTRYFCAGIPENNKLGLSAQILRLFNTPGNGCYGRRVSSWRVSPRGPSFSLSLGASRRALSECLWTGASSSPIIMSEKNVLHQIRTNPQAA